MLKEIKNTANQVGVSADGSYHVFWRGQFVYGKKFKRAQDAQNYLDRCDAEGRLHDG